MAAKRSGLMEWKFEPYGPRPVVTDISHVGIRSVCQSGAKEEG